jgi:predicted transcriptional regulator
MLMGRTRSFKESFKIELQKNISFSENFVDKFAKRLDETKDYKKQKENLPSNSRLKQIRGGRDSRIDVLQQLIETCDVLEHRRRRVFFKVVDSMKSLESPSLMQDDKVLTKEEFEAKLNIAKINLGTKFDSLTKFTETEIRK